jgi:hypothetical protein
MARNPFLEWMAPEDSHEGRAELSVRVREEFLQAR